MGQAMEEPCRWLAFVARFEPRESGRSKRGFHKGGVRRFGDPSWLSYQILDMTGRLPDYVVACVGGGSNAIGMFHPFVGDVDAGNVKLLGVEAGGKGMDALNSATLTKGTPGVLHGTKTYLLQVTRSAVDARM